MTTTSIEDNEMVRERVAGLLRDHDPPTGGVMCFVGRRGLEGERTIVVLAPASLGCMCGECRPVGTGIVWSKEEDAYGGRHGMRSCYLVYSGRWKRPETFVASYRRWYDGKMVAWGTGTYRRP